MYAARQVASVSAYSVTDCKEGFEPRVGSHDRGVAGWELLKLELGSVVDCGPARTWLKVPLDKVPTERMVPRRGHRRRVGRVDHLTRRMQTAAAFAQALTHFLFVAHGRGLGQTRLRSGLLAAVERYGPRGE
ncbi:hypothetical protein [Rhodococcus opacus]|uniref:hypothetical protein n=1 Tax=Rhodococcus opacus TaxID=37919 RepID=UPI0029549ED1|nr:hypothetical protein [Rhodococcus opacus]MDV7089131.1 hypothetical protein [Rhodococcus opacus]